MASLLIDRGPGWGDKITRRRQKFDNDFLHVFHMPVAVSGSLSNVLNCQILFEN